MRYVEGWNAFNLAEDIIGSGAWLRLKVRRGIPGNALSFGLLSIVYDYPITIAEWMA